MPEAAPTTKNYLAHIVNSRNVEKSAKFSYKFVVGLYWAARKVRNCCLYSEKLYAYLKIRNSMTRKGRMDVAEANYFSAPYCPITSTSGQRDLRAEVCSPFVIHHAVMMKHLPSIGWPIFGAEPVICKQKCNFNEGFSGYCFPGKLGFYFNELIF